MKLKKVASLCSKTKIFCLYDREESGGEVSQWLGDSSAIYPITGLPYMDEENIYSMFDISAKQQEKIIFRHQHAPEGINISDTAVYSDIKSGQRRYRRTGGPVCRLDIESILC